MHTFTNKPAIFMSTYNVVDKNLNFIFKRDMHYYWDFTLESTIVYRVPSGCTMVFNRNLFKLLVEGQPEFVRMHDYWTLLVAELVNAEIITTDEALLEYRQHGDNSVGFNKREFFKRIKRLIRSMISNKNERQRQGISLLKSYTKYIDGEQKDSLNKLVKYNSNFKSRIDLAFDRKYRTPVRQKICYLKWRF
ncbi:hypothetical protein ATO00_07130 [Loigolactobacillus coryniformis subsp. coryniformis]|nr:hypothetical protein ATO00_07130 [Loigolactobacillus coryniformis subsp. coryniformis]